MHKTNMKIFNFFVFAGLGLSSVLAIAAPSIDVHGVSFRCSAKELKKIEADVDQYLSELKIDKALYHKEHNKKKNLLVYALNTPEKEYDTLHLKESKRYGIVDEDVQMPISQTATTTIKTVSRKEIVLALFQHGRQTQFSGTQCKAESFIDHVGIRQNTVMWAQKLEWQWPEGGPAFWNKKFWDKGTPHKRESVVAAFLDTFLNQKQYGIGCYTATKIVMVQGVLDYYARIKPNAKALDKVIDRLYLDQDPLVNIEPQKMWSFEKDFDQRKLDDPGKILVMQHNVYPQNFVPGDWTYFLNTDEVSQQKTGYEGSNAIYLGNAKFDDYYNDNNHSYTYKEKLDEVYQWSNGVFSRSRDFKKIKPVTENDLKRFGLTPDQGGYVMEYRTHHEFYN